MKRSKYEITGARRLARGQAPARRAARRLAHDAPDRRAGARRKEGAPWLPPFKSRELGWLSQRRSLSRPRSVDPIRLVQ
jgi:hypothetical protein